MRVYRLAGTVVGTEDAVLMDMWGMDYISAKLIHNYLEEAGGEDIIFNLNSGGGSVMAGSEIYTMLKSYSGHVTINITGLSASIASVFMLGADEVNISHQGQVMIHLPSVGIQGQLDKVEATRVYNMLNSTEKSLVSVYKQRTGLSEATLVEMMANETWLTAEDAKSLGFVDNIIEDSSEVSGDVDKLVAMVHSAGNQLELLKEIKNIGGVNLSKTLVDKVKAILNGTSEEEVEVQEEVVTDPTEQQDTPVEELTEEVVEESVETPAEETKETPAEDQTELLEKAVAKIEELTQTVLTHTQENETLKANNSALETTNKELTTKDAKAQVVVAKLNALVSAESTAVVAVSQTTTDAKTAMPMGYKGFRGGQQ